MDISLDEINKILTTAIELADKGVSPETYEIGLMSDGSFVSTPVWIAARGITVGLGTASLRQMKKDS